MKKLIAVGVLLTLAVSALAVPITSTVLPAGDGQAGRDRFGFSYGWENSGFEVAENPNWAGHWYDSGSANGSSRTVYLQVAIPYSLTVDSFITGATLNLHITGVDGYGASLLHRTDASTATGMASQQLAGTVQVMDLTPANVGELGWLAIDVESFIVADIAAGYDFAVFSLPYKTSSGLSFSSGEDANFAPYLSVAVVPEPSSLSALLLGGLALIGARRFRPR